MLWSYEISGWEAQLVNHQGHFEELIFNVPFEVLQLICEQVFSGFHEKREILQQLFKSQISLNGGHRTTTGKAAEFPF